MTRSILTVGLLASLTGTLNAQDITFTKIIDTQTPIPGGPNVWNSFGFPVIHDGVVAFQGFGRDVPVHAIYTVPVGSSDFTHIVDTTIEIPDKPGVLFGGLWNPTYHSGTTIFAGGRFRSNFVYEGLYSGTGGPISTIVDHDFGGPSDPSHQVYDGNGVIFKIGGSGGEPIGYTTLDGNWFVVAGRNDPAPGGGTFFNFGLPSLANNLAAFGARVTTPDGGGYSIINYDVTNGQMRLIANENTTAPGLGQNFNLLDYVDTDGTNTVFLGFTSSHRGVYFDDGQAFHAVADSTTPVPGGTSTFAEFSRQPAVDQGTTVFGGFERGTGRIGLYAQIGGELIKVIDSTDTLDGKQISTLWNVHRSLSNGQFVFMVDFTDGVRAIYVANLPIGTCPADFNNDGTINTLDFLDFLNAYNTNDPAADFNNDGTVNTLDFLDFLNAFNASC